MAQAYEAIFCIVNSGYSDVVMEAAKKLGATGGTVIPGRGTAPLDSEKFFGITIEPEKDIVMMIVASDKKNDILHALYTEAGLDKVSGGIAFSIPVDDVVGLGKKADDKVEEKK